MRHLPAIVSGPGRWVLPFSDRSAALLAELLLADDRDARSGTLAEVLHGDPPLALWAVVAAVEREQFYPSSVSDLAAWLAPRLLALLQWPQLADNKTLGSAPCAVSRSGTESPGATACSPPGGRVSRRDRLSPAASKQCHTCVELARASLCSGMVAGEIASEVSPLNRAMAILVALVHNAPAWFEHSAVEGAVGMPEAFSRWLSACPVEAAALASQADAIAAGDRPASGLEVAALRRRAERAAKAWAAPLAGAGSCLPRLTARLAQLEQLESRFHEMLEHEKLEAMAELAAGAGHEINNPLAIIAGRAQLFLKDETDPERRREAAIIVAQVKRAHEMIADMRLFARPPRPEPQPFDLASLVDGLVAEAASQAAERATTLVRTGHAGPLPVELDPVQVSVAVGALVRNALEAIGHGGRIEIGLEGDDAWVAVRVVDNGPGISPEHRGHVFDPFFSARQAGRGLGMGLSKCWQIAIRHGGRVDVESRPGQGAVFTIRLPRRYPESAQRAANPCGADLSPN